MGLREHRIVGGFSDRNMKPHVKLEQFDPVKVVIDARKPIVQRNYMGDLRIAGILAGKVGRQKFKRGQNFDIVGDLFETGFSHNRAARRSQQHKTLVCKDTNRLAHRRSADPHLQSVVSFFDRRSGREFSVKDIPAQLSRNLFWQGVFRVDGASIFYFPNQFAALRNIVARK